MKTLSLSSKLALLACTAAFFGQAARTEAETIYAITDSSQLFSFDSATPGTVSTLTSVTGITAGQTLQGIDFRPATGQLFGMSYAASGAAQLYIIDLNTAVATPVGSGFALTANNPSARFAFDFNPVVDRIRVIGGNDTNLRLNPITGAIAATDTNVAYAAGDPGVGTNPLVAGAAYTNNFAGAATTTLYAYDFQRDSLVTVGNVNGTPNTPNGGMLFSVGSSTITANTGSLGFDISQATGFGYINADLAGGLDNLYTVNLATGALTNVGSIAGLSVLDISVVAVPEPSTVALLGVALAAGALSLWRRRRA